MAVAVSALVLVVAFVWTLRRLFLPEQSTIGNLLVVDGLEVCCKRLQGLYFEDLAALNLLGTVKTVVAHVEPLHLQFKRQVGDVAFRQELQDTDHLVEALEVVQWPSQNISEK